MNVIIINVIINVVILIILKYVNMIQKYSINVYVVKHQLIIIEQNVQIQYQNVILNVINY